MTEFLDACVAWGFFALTLAWLAILPSIGLLWVLGVLR